MHQAWRAALALLGTTGSGSAGCGIPEHGVTQNISCAMQPALPAPQALQVNPLGWPCCSLFPSLPLVICLNYHTSGVWHLKMLQMALLSFWCVCGGVWWCEGYRRAFDCGWEVLGVPRVWQCWCSRPGGSCQPCSCWTLRHPSRKQQKLLGYGRVFAFLLPGGPPSLLSMAGFCVVSFFFFFLI